MNNILDTQEIELLKQVYAQGLKQTTILLSSILPRKTQIILQEVNILALAEFASKYPNAQVILKFNISNDLQGVGVMSFSSHFSSVICDLLTGRDGLHPSSQIGQGELSIFSQIMGQFLNSLATSLSQSLNKKITFTVAEVKFSPLANEISLLPAELSNSNLPVAIILSKFSLENLLDEQFIQIFPLRIAKEIVNYAKVKMGKSTQKIESLSLSPLDKSKVVSEKSLETLLIDIPLQLNVELGRAKMKLKEILELGVGSIIELDRLAGEPVDILLNNKILAKGEVVVIDENLGVRLTEILNPNERI